MTLRRAAVVEALRAALAAIDPFPPTLSVDLEELSGWRDLGDGLQDSANIFSGKFTTDLRSGPENQWEGERDCEVAYAVIGADRGARIARRDLMVPALIAALQADRTLGTGDPQVFAEIGDATEDDDAFLPDAPAASMARVTVNILYVSDSAAG